VGTETISRHFFGGIPLPDAHRLGDLAIHDQGMAVVREHVTPIAWLGSMGLGFTAQQHVWISPRLVCPVAGLDASEITRKRSEGGTVWSEHWAC